MKETVEVRIDSIQIPTDRQRQEDDDQALAELTESIRNNGILNAIIIDRNRRLIAGGRRIAACLRLGHETITATYFESLETLDQKIIEFDENDKRKQLTWQEAARAVQEIHDLKTAHEGKSWSARDTARTLGVSFGKVSEDLTLAAALGNEKVAGRPTRRGALDTVKRERELALVRELARRRATDMGLSSGDNSTSFTSGVIYNANCLDTLKSVASGSIDLIVPDPPWGIDFDKASQWTGKWIATYDDAQEGVYKLLPEVFRELYRVLKPASHVYCFFPVQEIQWWCGLFTNSGFMVRQRPVVWYKTGQQGISDVYTSFLPTYESILWGYKPGEGGLRRLFSRPVPEAQGWPRPSHIWHENEKPVEMLDRWVETSSEINEVVLDPFCGGASVPASCFGLGRYYIGIEQDIVNYKKACDRMKGLEERKENEQDVS